jgi:hypothetical protein
MADFQRGTIIPANDEEPDHPSTHMMLNSKRHILRKCQTHVDAAGSIIFHSINGIHTCPSNWLPAHLTLRASQLKMLVQMLVSNLVKGHKLTCSEALSLHTSIKYIK